MSTRPLSSSLVLLLLRVHLLEAFFGGGSWCPYQVEKFIPCKVKNGTESYLGQSICWKSINGSFECTKRIIQRPKYITTMRRSFETRYKCCPGLSGPDCLIECFNCSTIKRISLRLGEIEKVLLREPQIHLQSTLEKKRNVSGHWLSSDEKKDFENRMATMLSYIRELELRIRNMESEISKLTNGSADPGINPSKSTKTLSHSSQESKENELIKPEINDIHKKKVEELPDPQSVRRKNGRYKKILEDNLERGDIASTLNDDIDYEEDVNIYSLSKEEEYDGDQLSSVLHQ